MIQKTLICCPMNKHCFYLCLRIFKSMLFKLLALTIFLFTLSSLCQNFWYSIYFKFSAETPSSWEKKTHLCPLMRRQQKALFHFMSSFLLHMFFHPLTAFVYRKTRKFLIKQITWWSKFTYVISRLHYRQNNFLCSYSLTSFQPYTSLD